MRIWRKGVDLGSTRQEVGNMSQGRKKVQKNVSEWVASVGSALASVWKPLWEVD